ncbi:hypothetical protein ACX0G9_03145 [Flavitalea flava]
MRQDLKHRLITWKNDVHNGEIKKVYISESPVKPGEYLIKVEKSMSSLFGDNRKEVRISKKYLTEGQQNANSDSVSDVFHINRIIDSLDEEFHNKFEVTVSDFEVTVKGLLKNEALRFSEN